jgi:ribonuclease Z
MLRRMVTEVQAGRYTLRGASLGGMYTSFHVPELDVLLDVGLALRGGCAVGTLMLSHAHVDHIGALPALLGMRGLCGVKRKLRVCAPTEVAAGIPEALAGFGALHRWPLEVEVVPMEPGDEIQLRRDLIVRAFRTWHPVPSLGYLFLRRVNKLRPEFADLPGAEIGRRRRAGDTSLFTIAEHHEFAYATDTLPKVLETCPELQAVRTLVLECTFLDERKTVQAARAGCHIHLDELLPFAPKLQNEALVLMHFSQLYNPPDVREILARRWPDGLRAPIPFIPDSPKWWN